MEANQIILEPVMTEKTNLLREGNDKTYVFRVHNSANKTMVMSAVKELFSVNPVSCNVLNVTSKPKRSRDKKRWVTGRTTGWKKAFVRLAPGESIELVEGA
jgi:large subunit ribosomal protein L23